MLSIGRVGAAGAGEYYLDRQAGCELDYYTGEGEARGRWLGDGAAALGLDGPLDEAGELALRALLSGCGADGQRLVGPVLRGDPRGRLDARPLIRALSSFGVGRGGADLAVDPPLMRQVDAAAARLDEGRAATLPADVIGPVAAAAGLDPVALYRRVDGSDVYTKALRFAGRQVDVRRPGLDVTVSAPKSVSLLYGLGDPAIASAVRAAHDVAVGEVVTYLQRHAATGARGHQGQGKLAPRVGSDGLIVAAFEHRTSRAGDPQLHTHLVIPNLVRGVDGRWSAMDTAQVYRHARTASSLYHAVLRGELTRTLGVGWTAVSRGIAEIDGVPRPVIDTFSKRRAQVVTALVERGTSGPKAAQAACLATRPAKTHEPAETLRGRWYAEAVAAGFDPDRLRGLTAVAAVPGAQSIEELAARLFGPNGVTREHTTFTREDLARTICEVVPPGTPLRLADVDALVTDLIAHPDVLPVLTEKAHEHRYTTRELVATEQHALDLATTPSDTPVGVTTMRHVVGLIERTDLTAEQKLAVHALVTRGRRVDVVAGPAGPGKTAALDLAHRIWAYAGQPVHGATVSWLAAQHLEGATGIPTRSLAKTLRDAEEYGLTPGVVVVLDEASLVNTRMLARLLEHVQAADGKLVLVGDPHQLPEIGAGGLFAALAGRDDTIHLTGNVRQHERWERDALRQLRDGDVVGALDQYVRRQRVHTAPSMVDLLGDIAIDYAQARERGEQVLVLAARRADVRRLNEAIRGHLIDTGGLGSDELTVPTPDGVHQYRTGEQVLVTANDRARGLVNGSRGSVTAVHPRHGTVQVDCDGRQVVLDRDWLATGRLAHGYATTVHKAQGLTVDTTLVYGLGPLTHEHAYVALSRGRIANHIYLAADTDLDSPDCGPREEFVERDERGLTTELLERIAASGRHQLASSRLSPHPAMHGSTDDAVRRLIHDQGHDRERDRGCSRSM
jgi:conjugative relaxase-like TrwC/TraI family protein